MFGVVSMPSAAPNNENLTMTTRLPDGPTAPVGPAQSCGASTGNGCEDSPTSSPAPDTSPLYGRSTAVKDSEKQQRALQVGEFLLRALPPQTILDLLDLMKKEKKPPSPPMAVTWELKLNNSEAILGENERVVVPREEVAPGGQSRGVVIIGTKFHGGHHAWGTGVLINKWTVATAGHLLFDAGCHAKNVVILAGKDGSDGNIESRDGSYAVVHHQWYAKRWEPNDLGFVRLREPFDTVTPMTTGQTPLIVNGTVYGYPEDMPSYAKGQQLCKSTSLVTYVLHLTVGMVEHEADTEKGTSGGPVLDAKGVVIAIHRGWAYKPDGTKINQAVSIDRDGNDFAAFVQILAYMAKYARKHFKDNGHEVGDVDLVAEKEGENIKVKVIREVEEVGGLAFTW